MRHNRHHKVSQSVPLFKSRKTVTIFLRIKVGGHFVMSIVKCHECHYVGVLDNPLIYRKDRNPNGTLHWWQRLKMHFNSDMDLKCFESTPKRFSNLFRARPIVVSASDIIPFSPNRDETSFKKTCAPRSPGEEFVNSLLNTSTRSKNPFKPDGAVENNHTSSDSSSE